VVVGAVGEVDEFGDGGLVGFEGEVADVAKAGAEVAGEGGGADVEEDGAVAVLEGFEVGVAEDDDVGFAAFEEAVEELVEGPFERFEAVEEGDGVALEGEPVERFDAGVGVEVFVVVAHGGVDGGDLFEAVEEGAHGDVAAVEDGVAAAEGVVDLGWEVLAGFGEVGV